MTNERLRVRALQRAGDLFYAEGINLTGVARVAQVLGMSKRTLYELFDSKDALVTHALAAREQPMRNEFIDGAQSITGDAAEQLVAVFTVLDHQREQPGFNGCPFLRASTEIADPTHPARQVTVEHKEAMRQWMEDRAQAAGLRSPHLLSQQLMLLFDGVLAHTAVIQDFPAISADTARILVDASRP